MEDSAGDALPEIPRPEPSAQTNTIQEDIIIVPAKVTTELGVLCNLEDLFFLKIELYLSDLINKYVTVSISQLHIFHTYFDACDTCNIKSAS